MPSRPSELGLHTKGLAGKTREQAKIGIVDNPTAAGNYIHNSYSLNWNKPRENWIKSGTTVERGFPVVFESVSPKFALRHYWNSTEINDEKIDGFSKST